MRFRPCFALVLGWILAGCATAPPGPAKPAAKTTAPPAPVNAIPRQLIIYIPQNDQSAMSWLKLFDKYPALRMTVAVSPRFQRFSKEPLLKEKVLALQKAGRLELALQLPNAPFLPLLINTDDARAALPPGAPLPAPPFKFSDDVTQIIAKAKADFAHLWGTNPKGLIVPQGAVNESVLKSLNQLGLTWAVAALGAPQVYGAYRYGSLAIWDATPVQEDPHFSVLVWDERMTGNPTQSLQALNTWAQDIFKKHLTSVLPSDPDLPTQDLPKDAPWGNRTWTSKDWSPWIGSEHKNSAWNWLRTTREALEKFKNSGQASVHRLDMAFEELYNAENANYFSGLTEGETTFTLADDREREFKATLSSVYRLIGQPPPDTLFSTENTASVIPGFKVSSTTVNWETLPDGRGHLVIDDAAGDDTGDGKLTDPAGPKAVPGTYDLRRVEVVVSSETLDWTITLGALSGSALGTFQNAGPLIDVYVDLNHQPNVGTVSFLTDRGASAAPSDAWEYALVLWGTQAQFYRTRGQDTYDMTDSVQLTFSPNQVHFSIPRSWMRGNPQRWGYQTLVMAYDPHSLENDARPLMTPEMAVAHRVPIFDLIDPLDIPQVELLKSIEEGKRNDIPFVRVPAQ